MSEHDSLAPSVPDLDDDWLSENNPDQKKRLEDIQKMFDLAVDLGCGYEEVRPTLRKYHRAITLKMKAESVAHLREAEEREALTKRLNDATRRASDVKTKAARARRTADESAAELRRLDEQEALAEQAIASARDEAARRGWNL